MFRGLELAVCVGAGRLTQAGRYHGCVWESSGFSLIRPIVRLVAVRANALAVVAKKLLFREFNQVKPTWSNARTFDSLSIWRAHFAPLSFALLSNFVPRYNSVAFAANTSEHVLHTSAISPSFICP